MRPKAIAKLTHLDDDGRARMVDVGAKPVTSREARAAGEVRMSRTAWDLVAAGGHPKGDVLTVAKIAGIAAAKRTWEIVPLAHQVPLDSVDLEFTLAGEPPRIEVRAHVRCQARTGVEMEALTAVAAAALAIYDMCKAADRTMTIGEIRVLEKRGGRSGTYVRTEKVAMTGAATTRAAMTPAAMPRRRR